MNLSKEKFLIKRHSERSHAVAKSKNLGRCVIASLVRGVAISCLLFLAACGDDPKVGGTEEDAGIIAIENKTVSGVSQKGPFVNGSSVKLYEMDGETLAPTGKGLPYPAYPLQVNMLFWKQMATFVMKLREASPTGQLP